MATLAEDIICFKFFIQIMAATAFFSITLLINSRHREPRTEPGQVLFKKYTYVTLARLAAITPLAILLVHHLLWLAGLQILPVPFEVTVSHGWTQYVVNIGFFIPDLAAIPGTFYFYYLVDKHLFNFKLFLVPAFAASIGLAILETLSLYNALTITSPDIVAIQVGVFLGGLSFFVMIAGYIFLIVKRVQFRHAAAWLLAGIIVPVIIRFYYMDWLVEYIEFATDLGILHNVIDLVDLVIHLISVASSTITLIGIYVCFKSSTASLHREEKIGEETPKFE